MTSSTTPRRRTGATRTIRTALAVGATTGLTTTLLVWGAPMASANACMSDDPPPTCGHGPVDPPPDPPESIPVPPPPPAAPAAPTNVSVSDVSSHSATLNWSHNGSSVARFVVTRRQIETAASAPVENQWTVPASSGMTNVHWTDSGLQATRTVSWTVVAEGADGQRSAGVTAGTMTVPIPADAPAQAQLTSFRNDWQSSAFPKINKAAVLADAVRIVQAPDWTIGQANSGACGPAAVEFELVHRHPDRFVDDVHALASTGAFTTADRTRYAASSILRASARNSSMTEANWLFMASVKDATNTIRITGSTPANHAAWISSPADVDNWLVHIVGLGKPTATAILRPFSTAEKVMPGAAATLKSGGAVVLLVDSHLVGNPPGITSSPNHYVNLLSWSPAKSTVTFKVATWGGVRTVTTKWSTFNTFTWNVLTAR